MGFLSETETAVTGGFTVVAEAFGSGLLDIFRPAFIVGFSIWIVLIAYEVAFGKSEEGFTYIFTKIGKIFFIGTLALYGWPTLAELLSGVKDGFVGANTVSGVLETNLISPIEELWKSLFVWFSAALQEVGWTELARLMSTLALFALLFVSYSILSLAVAVFGAIAMAMFLVANSVFILLFAIGPFFLLCLAFPFLQRFFEAFIGNVMTAILGMAFTVLMIMFVANLFGLVGIQNMVPATADEETVTSATKAMVILFAAKTGMALLIIYLYYKVFDLAAALGGGLNMGNNMVGGVRSILRDMSRGSTRPAAAQQNAMTRSGGGGLAPAASNRARMANRTFTGMAASSVGGAISSTGQTAIAGAQNLRRLGAYGAGQAAAAGRYAYNRYAQNRNRMSGIEKQGSNE